MANKRYLNIGSWNIEHFSKVGGRSESPYAIAEHIEMSGVDILALQELYVTSAGETRKNEDLDKTIELIKEHTEEEWNYLIFPNRNSGDKSQLCGVMWNEAQVKLEGDLFRIPVEHKINGSSLWDRAPHAVKFKSLNKEAFDVVVVSIHMKSNVKSNPNQNPKRIRALEAQTLMDKMEEVRSHFNENDIVIIGDTNCLGSFEKAIDVFEDNGFVDLNAKDSPTYANGSAPFDRAFIPLGEPEFKFTRQYILQSANPHDHDRFLSDHYMIKITIKGYKSGDTRSVGGRGNG